MVGFFEKMTRFICYFVVFIFPLFWLPFSFEILELNKIYFLFFFSWLGVIFWLLIDIIKERKVIFKYNFFDLIVFSFIFFAILSSIFSKDRINSLFGTYLKFSDGLVSLFSFFGFYLLLKRNLSSEKEERVELRNLMRVFFFSSFLALLFTYFSLFNLWQKIPILKFDIPFSPVGASIFSASLFFSVVFVLVFNYLFLGNEIKKIEKYLLSLFLILDFILLFLFDFNLAWLLIFISLIFCLFLFAKEKVFGEKIHLFLFPIFLSFLSLLFIPINIQGLIFSFFPQTQNFLLSLPREIILPQKESFRIAFSSLISSLKNIFFGSGPATFFEDFSLFKSKEFWNLRIVSPGNYFSQVLANFGILGTFSFSLLLGFLFLLFSFKKTNKELFFLKGFFLSVFLLPFLFYQNAIFLFLFWMGLAIASHSFLQKEKVINLKENQVFALFIETIAIILIIAFISFAVLGTRFYLADVNYKKGFKEADFQKKIAFFERATNLNPYQPYYKMALSQVLLQSVLQEIQKQNPDQNLISQNAAFAINIARTAQNTSPNNVLFKENLGIIYRELGMAELSLSSFEEALKLEPKNALFLFEIGKLQTTLSKFEEARKSFDKAIELSPNFDQAFLQKALVFELEKNLDAAISELENLLKNNPSFVEGLFHLGRLYYLKGDYEKAKENLQKSINLFSDYSNARFILALVYEKEGKIDKAIEELEKVEKLNPDSEFVKDKIKSLREKILPKTP
jgi:tetratricopeptide (TPR) repeat protein